MSGPAGWRFVHAWFPPSRTRGTPRPRDPDRRLGIRSADCTDEGGADRAGGQTRSPAPRIRCWTLEWRSRRWWRRVRRGREAVATPALPRRYRARRVPFACNRRPVFGVPHTDDASSRSRPSLSLPIACRRSKRSPRTRPATGRRRHDRYGCACGDCPPFVERDATVGVLMIAGLWYRRADMLKRCRRSRRIFAADGAPCFTS